MGEKDKGPETEENATGAPGRQEEPKEKDSPAGSEVPVRVRRPRRNLKQQVQELEERLARLEEERDSLEDQWLRARADFDNYRKRVERERSHAELRAGERILLGLLEIRDNLEKALASAAGEEGPLHEGLVLIDKQMASLLSREGVSPIEAVGSGFDPQLHEAVMQVESDEHESDTVVEELQTGYLLGDRLLRPARVTVAK